MGGEAPALPRSLLLLQVILDTTIESAVAVFFQPTIQVVGASWVQPQACRGAPQSMGNGGTA